jgi:hypothetical protein
LALGISHFQKFYYRIEREKLPAYANFNAGAEEILKATDLGQAGQ